MHYTPGGRLFCALVLCDDGTWTGVRSYPSGTKIISCYLLFMLFISRVQSRVKVVKVQPTDGDCPIKMPGFNMWATGAFVLYSV